MAQPRTLACGWRSERPARMTGKRNGGLVDVEIYLDNNATTRPSAEVGQAMFHALDEGFGNPSSDHARGQHARDAIHKARSSVACLIGADPGNLVFTSSATEANAIILRSAVERNTGQSSRIITTPVEHSSVLRTCDYLGDRGASVGYVPVDSAGVIDLQALARMLATAPVSLVSIQWANNETGVVQPVAEIGELCREYDLPLHVDAAQAIGKVEMDLAAMSIDFASLTAHKIHGPVGIGAIYARDVAQLRPLFFGGPQESGLRPGTENLPGIVGFGVAAQARRERFADIERQLGRLRDAFEKRVLDQVLGVQVNGAGAQRLANTTNLRFAAVDGQALVARLDQAGVRCSQSSACTSRHPEPSHVLRAMGLSSSEAWSSVRFSFAETNTMDDVAAAADLIAQSCERLRRFAVGRRHVAQQVEVG
jgi:cysteine desulfurase